jgi:hypothetical protein
VKPRDLATARADPVRDAISRVFGDVFSLAQVIV